jgi:hypothetical protein
MDGGVAPMKTFLTGVKMWWLRRFKGVVKPPRGQQGTTWYEHQSWEQSFECPCKTTLRFAPTDYVIRSQEHQENCAYQYDIAPKERCVCPVTDARYVKICPQCGIGHWRKAV